jgi:outer membrane protease
MKNIPSLTVLVIIVLAFFLNNPAYGEESGGRKYGFSFGQQYGFLHGQAFEYVYPLPGETKGELLSELKWDMKGVLFYGAIAEFGLKDLMKGPGFFSTVSFKTGLPADSGKMEDRDWMSASNDSLTNFSSHTNRTEELYWLDMSAGISFPAKPYLYIKLFVTGSWMRFSFTGRDGYGEYARTKGSNGYYPIDDNPDKEIYTGDVIRYKQNWFLAAEGISIGTKILSPFYFDLSFLISPFTYCAAVDEHIGSRTYMDFTGWGVFLEPGIKASFNSGPVEFTFDFSYRYIGKTRGETYIKPEGINYFSLLEGEAGAAVSLKKFNFILTLHL